MGQKHGKQINKLRENCVKWRFAYLGDDVPLAPFRQKFGLKLITEQLEALKLYQTA